MTSLALQVDPLFFRIPGGVGTYIRQLVPALAAMDPSLSIKLFHARLLPGSDSSELWTHRFPREELAHGIRTMYLGWNLTGRPHLPAGLASMDLVHAPSAVTVPPASRKQRLVVTVHDLAFLVVPSCFPKRWRAIHRLGLRAAVHRADAIITPSRNTADDLLARTSAEPSRVHVIPEAASDLSSPGGPPSLPARLDRARPYFLYVGTLEPRKNLVRLVQAYRRVVSQGIPHTLVLAGPRGWRDEELLREIAGDRRGNIVLTGALSPPDLDAVYRQAAVFVYPSLYEGFGLPVLEAMARGIPTICSNTSSFPEMVGDSALQVDPASVDAIASAIELVLADPELTRRLAIAGRERASQYSWEETARLTLKIYEHVLSN